MSEWTVVPHLLWFVYEFDHEVCEMLVSVGDKVLEHGLQQRDAVVARGDAFVQLVTCR
jgi:hypothetical protein